MISTGSELASPGTPLQPGQIYESNSIMLAAAVRDAGAAVVATATAGDDVAQFGAILDRYAVDADLIITSGGVSAGAYEVVKDAFGSADYRGGDHGVEFVKVAMQPGMPQGVGRVAGTPIVTLPGNPVSALVSFEVFIRPPLRMAMGMPDPYRPHRSAVLTASLDIAARQTSVPTRNTRSPGRHGHQLRPTGVAPFALVGIGQRTSGHPGGRRGGGCRNAAASLGLDLTGPILVPCTQPAARSSVR